jgi:hypothetical protein
MIAVAVAHRRSFDGWRLPHNCKACRGQGGQAKRKEWGCERKSQGQEPQFTIPCSVCLGSGCRECKDGQQPIWRCPLAIVDPGAVEARLLHHVYPQALPFGGGLCDQPAAYVQAMRILDLGEGRMQELEREEQEQAHVERRPDGRGK